MIKRISYLLSIVFSVWLFGVEKESVKFTHQGMECMIMCPVSYNKNVWGGYVQLPQDHPLYGIDLFEHWYKQTGLDIHEGIRFSDWGSQIGEDGW